jgi:hypothetical protein
MLLVDGSEEVRGRADRLRLPEQQKTGGVERVVKEPEHSLLQSRVEIDEHVPAADEVLATERWVLGQVVPGEDAHVADGLVHLIAAVHLGEEPLQAFRRDVRSDVLQIPPRPRLFQSPLGEVGREHLQGGISLQLSRALQQTDDDRIDLLASGASGHPHAERCAGRPILQQAREDIVGQDLEHTRVAKKGSDRDEAVLMEGLHLVPMALEVANVVLRRLDVDEGHPPRDPPLDGRRLVGAEVGSGHLAKEGQDRREPILPLRQGKGQLVPWLLMRWRDHVGVAAEAGELRGDLVRAQDEVHTPGGDRAARHAVMPGRARILGEGDASFRLDRLHSERPVRGRAGQDHADGRAPLNLRQRAQEGVDRHVLAPRSAARDRLQHTALDRDVLLPRVDIDVVGLESGLDLHLGDRHASPSRQQIGEDAFVARVQVLHEHVGHARVERERGQKLPERLQPYRGRPHSDNRERVLRRAGTLRVPLLGSGLGRRSLRRRGRTRGDRRSALLFARSSRRITWRCFSAARRQGPPLAQTSNGDSW